MWCEVAATMVKV